MSATGRSYLQNFSKFQYIIIRAILSRKLMKKFTVTDEKYAVSIRLLTIKDTSGTNMRTSHQRLSGKGCQSGEEDSARKILSYKK